MAAARSRGRADGINSQPRGLIVEQLNVPLYDWLIQSDHNVPRLLLPILPTCWLPLGVKSTTKGGHVRLLKLLTFCFFVLAFALLPCFAQTSTNQDSQKPATSQAPPAQQQS